MTDEELAAQAEQMDRDLNQILDVDDGLDHLFRRLGPPATEK